MNQASLFFILLLFFSKSWGQNYDSVERIVNSYPSHFETALQLANRINADFEMESEKVKALYNWMSMYVTYDYKNDDFDINKNKIRYFNHEDRKRQLQKRKRNRIERTLRYKKAECIGFSELFKEICDKIGIQSEVVSGYSKVYIKDIEKETNYIDHAWNVVKINNSWKLIDVTWASAFANDSQKKITKKFNDYYFFTRPEEFIATHFPANSQWQLITNKISKKDFFISPIIYPNYFWDDIEISKFQKGVVKANKGRLYISFDKIPKNKRLFYLFEGETFIKPIFFKQTKEGQYITSINYSKSSNSELTIYFDSMPVAGFKVISSKTYKK